MTEITFKNSDVPPPELLPPSEFGLDSSLTFKFVGHLMLKLGIHPILTDSDDFNGQ